MLNSSLSKIRVTLSRVLVAAACGILFPACAGNPMRGGIWWSEGKARERQLALREQLLQEHDMLAQAKQQRSEARRQLNAALATLRKAQVSTPSESKSASLQIARIERMNFELSQSKAATEAEILQDREKYQALLKEVEQLKSHNEILQQTF